MILQNILGQIELVSNWENELPWDEKSWYLNLLVDNISHLYASYNAQSYPLVSEAAISEIEIPEIGNKHSTVDPYWDNVENVLKGIRSKLANFCSHIILTGSLADQKIVRGWSDLDCMLIVKKSTLLDPELMKSFIQITRGFRESFKSIDRLAHHSFFIETECSVTGASFTKLPLGLFEGAVSLKGRCKLVLRRRVDNSFMEKGLDSEINSLNKVLEEGVMWHHARNNIPLSFPFNHKIKQMYQLKYLIGRILLLPCLFAQSKGIELGKKSAFDYLHSVIPAFHEMTYFEDIRANFPNYHEDLLDIELIPQKIQYKEFLDNLAGVLRRMQNG